MLLLKTRGMTLRNVQQFNQRAQLENSRTVLQPWPARLPSRYSFHCIMLPGLPSKRREKCHLSYELLWGSDGREPRRSCLVTNGVGTFCFVIYYKKVSLRSLLPLRPALQELFQSRCLQGHDAVCYLQGTYCAAGLQLALWGTKGSWWGFVIFFSAGAEAPREGPIPTTTKRLRVRENLTFGVAPWQGTLQWQWLWRLIKKGFGEEVALQGRSSLWAIFSLIYSLSSLLMDTST